MKTSFIATVALALFALPAVASAASLQYDPASKDNDQSHFVVVNSAADSATAAAAQADAARYAANTSGAVIGTHGDTGAKVILEANPSSDANAPRFISRVVIDNPANAEAAATDAAKYKVINQVLNDSTWSRLNVTHG
jgi:hypothetical protein